MTEFAAFLSYTRLDDECEGGRITKFAERLEAAVRQRTGKRDFQIIQDKKDIRWGQLWKQKIEQALGEVFILIPIVTPLYLASKACREEYDLFLKREKDLKRTDLILPVYWIDCDQIENSQASDADLWVGDLAGRQWANWRLLRTEPLGGRATRKAIEKMALQIKQTLATEPAAVQPIASPRPPVGALRNKPEWLIVPDFASPPDYFKKENQLSSTDKAAQTNVAPPPVPSSMTLEYLQTNWAALLRQDRIPPQFHKNPAVYYLRVYARPATLEDDCITLEFSKAMYKELVEKPENRREVEKLFEHILGKPYRVKYTLESPVTKVPAGMTPLEHLQTNWATLLHQGRIPPEFSKNTAVYYVRGYAHPVAVEDGFITLEFSKALYKELVEKPENKREVEKLFEYILGKPYRLMCTLASPRAAPS